MKPLSSCALFGATRALAGVRDAVLLQHSVVGCQWGSLTYRYAQKPYEVHQASTVIYENDVVNGGHKQLEQALLEQEQLYPNSNAVFVISGCIPNMIGDDVEQAIAKADVKKPCLHIPAPGYSGNIDSGIEEAYLALSTLVEEPKEKSELPSINIFGMLFDAPYSDKDAAELKRILEGKVKINCNLQNCRVEQLKKLSSASLNIVFGYGQGLAEALKKQYGTPYAALDYPYGFAGMERFLRTLEEKLGVDLSQELAELENCAKSLVYRSAEYLANIYQLPAAVVGDKASLTGMVNFLRDELGMRVVIAQDTAEQDLAVLEEQVRAKGPVLLCGNSFCKELAQREQIPFLRFTYPVIDQICIADHTMVGARGAAYIVEQIVNLSLQHSYKAQGLFAELRDELCSCQK